MHHIILGVIGVSCIVASIVFAIRDSKKPDIKNEETNKEEEKQSKVKNIINPIKKYYKSIIFATLSVVCFLGMYISKAREAEVFKSLYTVTSEGYKRYKDKNAELSGKTYAEKVRRKAMCEAGKDEYGTKPAYQTPFGDTLFYEIISHSHIYCSFQRIREIEAELNAILEKKEFVPLIELYKRAKVKLPAKQEWLGKALGWNRKDGDILFEYYPQMLKNGEKAIVLGFKVSPHYSYK